MATMTVTTTTTTVSTAPSNTTSGSHHYRSQSTPPRLTALPATRNKLDSENYHHQQQSLTAALLTCSALDSLVLLPISHVWSTILLDEYILQNDDERDGPATSIIDDDDDDESFVPIDLQMSLSIAAENTMHQSSPPLAVTPCTSDDASSFAAFQKRGRFTVWSNNTRVASIVSDGDSTAVTAARSAAAAAATVSSASSSNASSSFAGYQKRGRFTVWPVVK